MAGSTCQNPTFAEFLEVVKSMICNCCHQTITAVTVSAAHVYRFGMYAEIAPGRVVRYGTICRAVCRDCVAAIERAQVERRNQRSSGIIKTQRQLQGARCV
jgi:hypothetical protein